MATFTKITFQELLDHICKKFNTVHQKKLSGYSALEFEAAIVSVLKERLSELGLRETIEYRAGSTSFPDITIGNYGIEAKSTESDKWECTGNSILEGTRKDSIDDIYVVFLKKGGVASVRWKKYEESIADIKVTHSPRYYVNLDLDVSIFKKLGVDYYSFKNLATVMKISHLRRYYKNQNQESWWIDPSAGEQTTPFGFSDWGSLPIEQKKKLKVQCYALFPEILKPGAGDFSGVSAYLMLRHNCLNRSVRDAFTAGGRQLITIRGSSYELSRACFNFFELRRDIRSFVAENSLEIFAHFGFLSKTKVYESWLLLLDRLGLRIAPVKSGSVITARDLIEHS